MTTKTNSAGDKFKLTSPSIACIIIIIIITMVIVNYDIIINSTAIGKKKKNVFWMYTF